MKRGMKVYFAGIVIVLVLASVIIYCSRQTDIVEHGAYTIMLFEAARNIAAGIIFALPFMQFVSIKAGFREKVLITITLVVLSFGRIIYFLLATVSEAAATCSTAELVSSTAIYFQFAAGAWIMFNIYEAFRKR